MERPPPPSIFANNKYQHLIPIRSRITADIGHLRLIEDNTREAYARVVTKPAEIAHRDRAQAERNRVHRTITQHLAQVASEHAQLSYGFDDEDLVFTNRHSHSARRAIRCCVQVIEGLSTDYPQYKHHPSQVHPDTVHLEVLKEIYCWYSPAFGLSHADFHQLVLDQITKRYNDNHQRNGAADQVR
jgi:hypothetical protein